VAVCNLGFFKIDFFEQLVSSGGLICVIVQNFVKIGQTVSEIWQFFDFQDSRRPPSWIFKTLFFEHFLGSGGPMCVSMQNFFKKHAIVIFHASNVSNGAIVLHFGM